MKSYNLSLHKVLIYQFVTSFLIELMIIEEIHSIVKKYNCLIQLLNLIITSSCNLNNFGLHNKKLRSNYFNSAFVEIPRQILGTQKGKWKLFILTKINWLGNASSITKEVYKNSNITIYVIPFNFLVPWTVILLR